MSQLRLYTHDSKEFLLNITQFRSPMNATIASAQTKTMLMHFPIRTGQPDINFTAQFRGQDEKHAFESFVRQHMQDAQKADQNNPHDVTLWWPERNIENWTGYITSLAVTQRRFETAASITFGVALVDSLMSEKTTLASRTSDVWKILGAQIPAYRGYQDTMLIAPTRPSSNPPVNPDTRPPSGPVAPPAINSGDAPR